MRAVVGHELAHFSGADTMFTRFFYPIFRTSSDAEARLDVETESLMGAILLEPARAIFDLFFEQFRRAEARISRDRELAADARGAEISSAHDAATALVKLHLLAAVWSHTRNVVRLGELSRQPIANASMEFVRWAQDREGAPSLDRLLEERLTHPIDSHPPLADRLKALSLPEAEIAQMPAGEPLHPAIRR